MRSPAGECSIEKAAREGVLRVVSVYYLAPSRAASVYFCQICS